MMTNVHDLLAYLGLVLLAAGIPLAFASFFRLPGWAKVAATIVGIASVSVPFLSEQPLLFYARGIIGEISVPTQMLFAQGLARALGWRNRYTEPFPRDVGALLIVLIAPLTLCTLGYLPYDLYAWGYQPRLLLVIAAGLLAYAWWRHPGMAVAWLAGLACFAIGILPSVNLWDALGDPLLGFAGVWLLLVGPGKPIVAGEPVPSMTPALRRAA